MINLWENRKSSSVLVVDDTRQMADMIRKILHQLGFSDIDLAYDGSAALQKMGLKQYSVVMSDFLMHPMTGIELARTIKNTPQWASVPVLMITGAGDAEQVIAAKEAGVAGYVLKPFTVKTLRAALERVRLGHEVETHTASSRRVGSPQR